MPARHKNLAVSSTRMAHTDELDSDTPATAGSPGPNADGAAWTEIAIADLKGHGARYGTAQTRADRAAFGR